MLIVCFLSLHFLLFTATVLAAALCKLFLMNNLLTKEDLHKIKMEFIKKDVDLISLSVQIVKYI